MLGARRLDRLEALAGFARKLRTHADLDHVILCVDQSGSMASSVIYASIFAAVMASLPVISTKLVCFDTTILDLTEQLANPVDVLFGVQLGGGTDINAALAYCERQIEQPAKTHLVLISDLDGGGNAKEAPRPRLSHDEVVKALDVDGVIGVFAKLQSFIVGPRSPVMKCEPSELVDTSRSVVAPLGGGPGMIETFCSTVPPWPAFCRIGSPCPVQPAVSGR